MAGISLNTKIEQLYKLLESCKLYLSPSDTQRQSDVIPSLRHIYELVRLPTVKNHSTFPRLLTTAVNHLLTFCGSRDQAVQLAASDVLNKTIKVLQQDHMARVIGELFQEVKKQGESRVLRAALMRFAILCSRIRQQKCPQYAQQLLPVVTQLLSRQDDSLQDCLQDSLPKLLMVFGTYYSEEQLVELSESCVQQLASENAANRRTAAEILPLLCQQCMKPVKCTKWSIAHMMQGLLVDDVKDHVICGLLLCLRQLIPLVTMETDNALLLPKIYCLLLRCCLHSNHNVLTSALEALSVFLWKPVTSLITWLTTELDHMTSLCPISCYSSNDDKVSSPSLSGDVRCSPPGDNDTPLPSHENTIAPCFHSNSDVSLNDNSPPSPSNSDTPSLSNSDIHVPSSSSGSDKSTSPLPNGDEIPMTTLTPCDDHFILSLSTADASVSVSLASAHPTSATPLLSCDLPDVDVTALQLPGATTCHTPIQTLLQLLGARLLTDNVRISVKAVAMQCIVAIATWSPQQLLVTMEKENSPKLIELLLPYMEFDDPKLCGNSCQVLCHYIKGLLLWDSSDHVMSLSSAIDKVVKVISDSSATVLHTAIPSLQAFLVTLATSHHSNLLDVVMETLLDLTKSQSYWLVKCDLLNVLTSLDHTVVSHTHQSAIVQYVLSSLRDNDSRVQDHAVEAVARLVKYCCVDGVDHMIQTAQHMIPKYLNATFYSVNKSHVTVNKDHMIQPGLSTSLQFILKCCHDNLCHYAGQHEMVGVVKCIRQLCHDYPPTHYVWYGQLSIIEHLIGFMEGSSLSYDLCCHANMLFVTSSLTVAMATKHLVTNPEPNKEWAAIGISPLVTMVKKLFKHCVRCIKICHSVLEEQVSDVVTKATATTPTKISGQKTKSVKKELPKAVKHNHGNFASTPHYVKLFTTVKNVYAVYQVTMKAAKTDKFYTFLYSALGALATLLDIALADDVAKHTEEICSYLSVLNTAEPWTGLLCVQQLLNALFGMNTAAHRVNILSPILLSHVTSNSSVSEPQTLLSDILLVHPLDHMISSLTIHEEVGMVDESTDGSHSNTPLQGIKRLRGLFSKKTPAATNTMTMDKPANSSATVKEHIKHIEPLVVSAMKQFSSTTSLLLQERTLFLVVQLLHLRVNYQLLDPNKTFLDSVLKLLNVIEEGHVRGSAQLIPYLFQFLVLLSREQPKLMSIPEVMQKCDQVLASGRNVSTYAIPALQPLVVNLFMKNSLPLKGDQLEAEREVVFMMMLRLLGYHQVVSMCALVLEWYHDNTSKWVALSDQILPVLLPYMAKFDVTMDTRETIASQFKLMTVIAMKTYNIRAMFELLVSKSELDTVDQYVMWVGLQCAVLRSVNRLLHESQEERILTALEGCSFTTWPLLSIHKHHILHESKLQSSSVAMQLVGYFMGSFHYCLNVIEWLHTDLLRSHDHIDLLTQLCFDWLLSLQYINKCPCDLLRTALRDHVTQNLPSFSDDKWWNPVVSMANYKPLISLHISELLSLCGYHDNSYWEWFVTSSPKGPYQGMLCHVTFLVMCRNKLTDPLRYLLGNHANHWVCMINDMWAEEVIQQYWKGSCDPTLMFTALSSLNYDNLTALQIGHSFRLIARFHDNHHDDVIPLLCKHFVGSHVLAVAMAAQRIITDKLRTKTWSDVVLLQQLLNNLPPSKYQRCTKILEAISETTRSPLLVSNQSEYNNSWLEHHIKQCCHDNTSDSTMCAQLLHHLSRDVMATVMKNQDFSSSHLACCLATGIQYTKSSKLISLEEVGPDVTRNPDKLLVVAKEVTLSQLESCDPGNDDLLLATVWLLLASSLLGNCWENSDAVTMVKYVEKCIGKTDKLAQVVAMLLKSHDLSSLISDEAIQQSIALACHVTGLEPMKSAQENIIMLLDTINVEVFHKHLIYGLARLPLVNSYATAPPSALQLGWEVGQEMPKSLLKERNVVEEGLIKRTNQIGWLSRLQFEEVWMQSLSVLNSSITDDDDNQLEDHVMLTCRGIQSIMSLLVMTLWRPEPGNPLIGSILHTCRHRNIPFLDSKPGKHFAHIRQRIENELLVVMSTRNDMYGYHGIITEDETQIHLYSNNIERKIGSHDLSYGQLSMPSIWSIIYHEVTNDNTAPQGRGDVDTRSCVVLLLDLFTQWLNGGQLSHVIISEVIRCVVIISDLFFSAEQYDWMLLQFVAIDDQLPGEDTIAHSYLIYGMLKCIAVLRMPGGSIMDHVIRTCDIILQDRHGSSILLQEACLRGLLYCMEIIPSGIISSISNSLCSYCLEHLKRYQQYCEQHLLLVWAVTMVMIECHTSEIHQENFITSVVMISIDLLKSHDPLMSFYRALCHGLEQLLLTFSLTSEHRSLVAATSISRLQSGRSGYCGTLSALGLLLCCVYTGDEGEALFGVTMDTTAVARERITSIVEWLRRAPHPYTLVIAQILPQLMVDLLPASEAVSMIMNEFLSPQQVHMKSAAAMLVEVFQHIHRLGNSHVITKWMLLMIGNVLKRKPVAMAIWYSCCLFVATCTSDVLLKMLPLVTSCSGNHMVVMETFHHAGVHFYTDQLTVNDDRVDFIGLLTEVSSLHQCYQKLLTACNNVT